MPPQRPIAIRATYESRCHMAITPMAGSSAPLSVESLQERIAALERQLADCQQGALRAQTMHAMFEHMHLGIIIYQLEDPNDDSSLQLITANPAARMFVGGFDILAHVGKRITEIFPNISAYPESLRQYSLVASTGVSQDMGDLPYYDEQLGLDAFYSVQAVAIGEMQVAILFEDVTERKRAEDRIRVYEETIGNMETGVVVLHLTAPDNPESLTIIAANQQASYYTELDLQHKIGARFSEVFPDAVVNGRAATYAQVAASGKSAFVGEFPAVIHGQHEWVSIKAVALPDHRVSIIFDTITERKRAEEMLRQNIQQEETILAQQTALEALSTPLIPLNDRVVVMPLVGALDSRRAQRVMDTLLEGITTHGASIALLDITGVTVVDTQVASALVRAAQAAKLLGTQVMITGIRPEVAQTLIGLGVDLSGIVTQSTLQTGVSLALLRPAQRGAAARN
ncbi:PAS domain-containing protein [Chloroflexia bacterium SDU3-3]|nr:PAS domain-containing protein [Chloroflexia bacterium SDU3-3]